MDVPHLAKKDFVLRWPESGQVRFEQSITGDEPCEVEFRNGVTHLGTLLHFTGTDPFFVFRPHSRHPLNHRKIFVRLSNVRRLLLPRPVKVIPLDTASLNESGATVVEAGPQLYSLEYFDAKIVSGETTGFVRSDAGLYLYSPRPTDTVIRSFIPNTSIAYLQMGEAIGKLLVDEHAISEIELADALQVQKQRRSALLGDYLIEEGFTTRAQLDQALALQKLRPSLRLGEALIELGLLTSEALHAALAQQRADRVRPIGEILVEMGALDTQTLTKICARKLGLPYVDLTNAVIHPTAINRLSAQDARALGALPLSVNRDCITLAITGPADLPTLSELSSLTGMRVMTVLASADQIRKKQDEYYPEGVAWEDPGTAESVHSHIPSGQVEQNAGILRKILEDGETVELTNPAALPSDELLQELLNRMMSDALSQGELHLSIESGAAVRRLTLRFRRDCISL
jgi:hypothetical protein